MKRFLTILSFTLLLFPAMAQEMHIESNGNNTVVNFNDFEKMTFEGAVVTVAKTDGTSENYNMGDITRIHFGYYNTAISDQIQTDAIRYISSCEVEIYGGYGTMVHVYDMTGTQILGARLKEERIVINLSQYPKGIYIVRTEGRTFKVVRR